MTDPHAETKSVRERIEEIGRTHRYALNTCRNETDSWLNGYQDDVVFLLGLLERRRPEPSLSGEQEIERLRKTGTELAEIVRSVQGHNGFVMLTQEQIEWLCKVLADYFPLYGPTLNETAAAIDGELHRAALKPIPPPQRRPSESLAEWDSLAATPKPVVEEEE